MTKPTAKERAEKSPFETAPCGRCGGSGTYSRCETWGDSCFKCGSPHKIGSGYALTKRGTAARELYLSLLPSKPVAELKGGERFHDGSQWQTLLTDAPEARPAHATIRIGDGEHNIAWLAVDLVCHGVTLCRIDAEKVVRVAPTAEQKADALARALAYQATLTKRGIPRKRAAGGISAHV